MTTLLYTHAVFGRHEVPPGHVEHPGRYAAVEKALGAPDFEALERRAPPRADVADVTRVHPQAFYDAIDRAAPAEGLVQFDADTFMGPSSLEASLRAAGGACDAVEAVLSGAAKNAFIAARPPGHHAEPERAMGFCLFNGAAIAALHAREKLKRQKPDPRVAVLDFDVHHGNGTEAAFWHDADAFYGSSHEWPQYPGTGRSSDEGAFGNIANAPLPGGTGSDGFRRAWGEKILPALDAFGPDFIVISAGFDAHSADPLGGLKLTEADFDWVTREIGAMAAAQCAGRVVSLMEGGYNLQALAASAAAHVRALMDL